MSSLETIGLEWKNKFQILWCFQGIVAPFLVQQEWGFGGFNNKDGKGIQIAPFECTGEDGIWTLATNFDLSLVLLEIKFLPHKKNKLPSIAKSVCYHFKEIITVYFDKNGTHEFRVWAKFECFNCTCWWFKITFVV